MTTAAFCLTIMIAGVVLLAGVGAWWLCKRYQTGPALASTEDVPSSPSGA